MFVSNPVITARSIITTSTAVGAKLPAPVLDAVARADRVLGGLRGTFPGQDALPLALIDALDAGNDPAEDPTVLRVIVGQQVGASGLSQAVDQIVGGQLRETMARHANDIVKAWAVPFTKAATSLTAAHKRIGDVPLEDTGTILQAGGDVADVWASAQHAADVLREVADAWVLLAQLTGFAPITGRYDTLRITDTDRLPADLRGKQSAAWDVLCAGLSLSLADGPDFRRRVAAIEQAQQDAATQAMPEDRERAKVKEWAAKTEAATARRVSA